MILLLALAFIAVIYSRSIRGGFLFDDHVLTDFDFERRRHCLNVGWQWWGPEDTRDTKTIFGSFFTEPRSLTNLGYLWTWELAGLNPFAWHLVNVFFHAANTVLVYLLALTLLPEPSAEAAAFLFAVHPHQVAAVSYISGRPALQACFFALACVVISVDGYFLTLPVSWLAGYFAIRSKEDGGLWTIVIMIGYAILFVALRSWRS